MKRKDFLQISVFTAVAIGLPFLDSCHPGSVGKAIAKPAFLSRLFNDQQISEAGKAYLRQNPKENSKDKLIDLLSGNTTVATSTDQDEIQRFLEKSIITDFESGKTMIIGGWVLAVTEARQCALFSLVYA